MDHLAGNLDDLRQMVVELDTKMVKFVKGGLIFTEDDPLYPSFLFL